MALSLPLLLRRLRRGARALRQHSLPLALPVPGGGHGAGSLVRARRPLMGARDGRSSAPSSRGPRGRRARARRLPADEGRPRRALRRRDEKIVVTPLGADPASRPGGTRRRLRAARRLGRGAEEPARGARGREAAGAARRRRARRRTRRLRPSCERAARGIAGFVPRRSSSSCTAAPPALPPTRSRASGCPCSRRWPAGTPVVATPDPAVQRGRRRRRSYAEPGRVRATVQRVLADPDRSSRPGSSGRARSRWRETAAADARRLP